MIDWRPHLVLAACLAGALPAGAQEEPAAERMTWWREARFGLFVHWGLYAIPAGRWGDETHHGEWIRDTARIPRERYAELAREFDPVRFDADAWAELAARAGMGYVVITSKHHDGFCLWDSELTDFDVASTPFGRDVLAEVAEAFRGRGLRVGWYHSILDWSHRDYLPRRGWEEAARPAGGADFERYVAHLHGQVTELLTRYGDVGVMWFDGEWERNWNHQRGQALYDLCRSLQPDVIVNNRVDVGREGMAGLTRPGGYAGDFGTPEQEVPAEGLPGVDWESCLTMNDHWGWNAEDDRWKSSRHLIRTLVDVASKGGNLLLNVGPKADGTFPAESVERLEAIGRWMGVHGEAIHGTGASPLDPGATLAWGRCTLRTGAERSTLYLHVFERPADGRLLLPGLASDPLEARVLGAPGAALAVARVGADLAVGLPAELPDADCSVVALDFEGPPTVHRAPQIVAAADVLVDELVVTLRGASRPLELRYTLDGSDPGADSPRYDAPLVLTDSAFVRARAFLDGRPVSGCARRDFVRVEPLPALVVENARPGLERIEVRGEWERLPDFAALAPAHTDVVAVVDLPPSYAEERVGLRLRGFLRAPRAGLYRFALTSDDGSSLTVAGIPLIQNDGLHVAETVEGFVPLEAGLHRLEVAWFNRTGEAELRLEWAPPGQALGPVPGTALWRE